MKNRTEPKPYAGILVLGLTVVALGGFVAAVLVLRAYGKEPSSAGALDPALAGRIAFEDGDFKEALSQLERAVQRPTCDRQTKLLYARTLGMLGRISQAQAFLAEMIKAEPKDVAAISAMAEVLEAAGELEHAVMYAQRAAHVRPQDAYLWKRLALLQLRAGQGMEAMASAERSLELDPEQEDMKKLMAQLAAKPPGLPEGMPGAGGRKPAGHLGMIPGMPEIPDPRSMVPDPRSFMPGSPSSKGASPIPGQAKGW